MTSDKFIEIPKTHEVRYVEQDKTPTIEEILARKQQGEAGLIEAEKNFFKQKTVFPQTVKVYCAFVDCPWSSSFEVEIYKTLVIVEVGPEIQAKELLYPVTDKKVPLVNITGEKSLIKTYWCHSPLNSGGIYTVGYLGQYCWEGNEFRKRAIEIVQDCAKEHRENGTAIDVKETIDSECYHWNKSIIRIAVSEVASRVLGPEALPIGAYIWLTSRMARKGGTLPQLFSNDKDNKLFWEQVEGIAKDVAIGGCFEALAKLADSKLGEQEIQALCVAYDYCEKGIDFFKNIEINIDRHNTHISEGKRYDSNCSICKND